MVVVAHGFNGLRIILLEWRQGAPWTQGGELGGARSSPLARDGLRDEDRDPRGHGAGDLMDGRELTLRIQRFDPSRGEEPAPRGVRRARRARG